MWSRPDARVLPVFVSGSDIEIEIGVSLVSVILGTYVINRVSKVRFLVRSLICINISVIYTILTHLVDVAKAWGTPQALKAVFITSPPFH